MIGEPPSWAAARKARLQQQYPIPFGNADASTILGMDAEAVAQGRAPTDFSQTAMRLATQAGQTVKQKP